MTDTRERARELLPCPFCRGPAVNVADDYITCGSPRFMTCAGKMVRTDAETWNTRTPPSISEDDSTWLIEVVSSYFFGEQRDRIKRIAASLATVSPLPVQSEVAEAMQAARTTLVGAPGKAGAS